MPLSIFADIATDLSPEEISKAETFEALPLFAEYNSKRRALEITNAGGKAKMEADTLLKNYPHFAIPMPTVMSKATSKNLYPPLISESGNNLIIEIRDYIEDINSVALLEKYSKQISSYSKNVADKKEQKQLLHLSKTIKNYINVYYENTKPAINPGGLFEMLAMVQLNLDPRQKNVIPINRSKAFKILMLRNITIPVMDLFAIIEQKGNLGLKDIKALENIITDLQKSYELYKTAALEEKELAIKNLIIKFEVYHQEFDKDSDIYKQDKSRLENTIRQTELNYLAETEITKEIVVNTINEIKEISQRVSNLEFTALYYDLKKQASELKSEGKLEEYKIAQKKVYRLYEYIDSTPNATFAYSEFFINYCKNMANKNQGKMLLPLSQGTSAEMGNSHGLCQGFTIKFLKDYLENNKDSRWQQLSPSDKAKSIISASKNRDIIFNWQQSNELSLSLEESIYWANQGKTEYAKQMELATITPPPTNWFQKITPKKHSPLPAMQNEVLKFLFNYQSPLPQALLLSIYDEDSGHALGVIRDKDGFYFHDSNSGVYYFNSEKDFANFFKEYYKYLYPDFDATIKVQDYQKLTPEFNQDFKLFEQEPYKTVTFSKDASGKEEEPEPQVAVSEEKPEKRKLKSENKKSDN